MLDVGLTDSNVNVSIYKKKQAKGKAMLKETVTCYFAFILR